MSKKVREVLALLFFFICTILILQITQKETEVQLNKVVVPKQTKLYAQLNQNELTKKIVISELYNKNGGEFVKKIVKYNNRGTSEEKETNSEIDVFLENMDANLKNPLELLLISIDNKDIAFLRTRSQYESQQKLLYSSNHGFLYLQLMESSLSRDRVLSALNNTSSFPVPSSSEHDIRLFHPQKRVMEELLSMNFSKNEVAIILPKKNQKSQKCKELKTDGFHFFTEIGNNLFDLNTGNSKELSVKSISLNYFGLNSYDDPLIFPNADYLFEFDQSISASEFLDFIHFLVCDKFSLFGKDDMSFVLNDELERGTLTLGDMELGFQRVNSNSFFIGTSGKGPAIQSSIHSLNVSGDPSYLMNIKELTGWKGFIIEELISASPLLSQLRKIVDGMPNVRTKSLNNETRISIKFDKIQSVYSHLLDLVLTL